MQSKRQSMMEAWASTGFGFVVSLMIWAWVVNPLYGLHTSPLDGLGITLIFTAVSIIRGYYTRRWFNWLHSHNKNKNLENANVLSTWNRWSRSLRQRHGR